MFITKDGAFYRRYLPHFRSPGGVYHIRFSLIPHHPALRITDDWMFAIIENAILADHKQECMIHAYIIMADHSHAVIQPLPRMNTPSSWCDCRAFYPLEHIIGRIKGRSAYCINRGIARSGPLWQDESFDRLIRNERDFEETIDYIHHNSVRWKLVERPEQYRWSSLSTIYSGREQYGGWFDLPYAKT